MLVPSSVKKTPAGIPPPPSELFLHDGAPRSIIAAIIIKFFIVDDLLSEYFLILF